MITKEEIKELEEMGEVKKIMVDGKEEIYLMRFCGNGPNMIWWQKISELPSDPEPTNVKYELNEIIDLETSKYLLGQKTLQEAVEGINERINAIVNKVLEQSDKKIKH